MNKLQFQRICGHAIEEIQKMDLHDRGWSEKMSESEGYLVATVQLPNICISNEVQKKAVLWSCFGQNHIKKPSYQR